jgi:hypothetical protein
MIDLNPVLAELRAELARVNEAIAVLEPLRDHPAPNLIVVQPGEKA